MLGASRWGRDRLLALGSVALVLLAVGVAVPNLAANAHASSTLAATVSDSSSGSNVVDLATMSYSDATSTLAADGANGTSIDLPVAPAPFAGVTIDQATVDQNDSSNTLTVRGQAPVVGETADVLVVAHWSDPSSTPTIAVLLKFENAPLTAFVPSAAGPTATLDHAWIGMTRSSSGLTVATADLPASDGDYLDADMLVKASGFSLRGEATSGNGSDLGTALSDAGLSSVTLDGAVSSTSLGSSSSSVSLTASVQPNTPSSWPSSVQFPSGSPWTLSVSADMSAGVSVSMSGSISVTLDQSTFTPTATIAVTHDKDGFDFNLTAGLGDQVNQLLGVSWLTLNSAQASLDINSGGEVSADLNGSVTIDSTTFNADLSLAKSDASTFGLSLSSNASVSAQGLAGALGAPTGDLPTGFPNLTLSNPSLAVTLTRSSGSTSVAFEATADAQLTIGSFDGTASVLVRYTPDGFTVAAAPQSSLHLSDLGINVSGDPALPQLSVVFSSDELKGKLSSFDAPTQQYFGAILCPNAPSNCDADLDVAKGVGIEAAISLPQQLVDALGKIGLTTSDSLQIEGQIPAFGGDTLGLKVHLPTTTPSANADSFLQGTSLDLDLEKTGANVTLSLDGAITVGIPRTDNTCPSNTYVQGKCIDLVTFGVSAGLTLGDNVSFTLTGSLQDASGKGWQQPFGIPWLTLYNVTVELGVTTGEGAEVTLGFRGSLDLGSHDLTVGLKVGVTEVPPFIDFQGFTAASAAGISMADLGSLYNDIVGSNGPHVDPSALPPVGIKNLFLSFGRVDDPALCLRSGFYLSGDLYLTSGDDHSTDTTPQCSPGDNPVAPQGNESSNDPGMSPTCQADQSHCLASILVDVSTGLGGESPGITAAGYVSGWSAGPLSFDPTDLLLELNATTQRIYLSGGATLLDPVEYKIDPSRAQVWASGKLTLDVSPEHLLLDGSAQLAGLQPITIHAAGDLSLSKPNFDLDAFLPSGTLDKISGGVSTAVSWVKNTADTFKSSVDDLDPNALANDFNNAISALSNPTSPATWQTLWNTWLSVKSAIDGVNNVLSTLHLPTIPTDDILQMVLHGYDFTVAGTTWFHTPGLCNILTSISHTPVCTAGVVDGTKQAYVDPTVNGQLAQQAIAVPTGATTDQTVDRFAQLSSSTKAARTASRLTSTDGTAQTATATCAVAPVSYQNGTIGNTQVDVNTLGTTVAVPGPSLAGAGTDSGNHTISQGTVNALVTGDTVDGCQGTPPVGATSPQLTLSLNKAVVDEGSTVTASGILVDGASGATVTLDWGDGTPLTVVTPDSTGRFSWTHSYPDNPGSGQVGKVTITASSSGATDVTRGVLVANVAPSVTDLNVSPSRIDEGSSVTLTGAVTDPGVLDTHNVTVQWGDGSTTGPVAIDQASDTFRLTHTYENNSPIGSSDGPDPITVIATDNDGANGVADTSVDVADVPPANVTLSAANSLIDIGTVFTHVGTPVAWTGTFDDVGLQDVERVDFGWGDGNTGSQQVLPTNSLIRLFATSYTWSAPCLQDVTTTVTDDDGESAPTLHQAVVVTAPAGAAVKGPGWWQAQIGGLISGHGAPTLTATQAGCYLAIARHVSAVFSSLGVGLNSLQAAYAVLHSDSHTSRLDQERAKLDRVLLVALLNFANGAWEWNSVAVPTTYETFNELVADAARVQAGTDLSVMQQVRVELQNLNGSP